MNTQELRKAARCVFLACEKPVAQDLADKMNGAAHEIDELEKQIAELKDFCIWLTGCGYDFCQHDYFIKQRDKLLLDHNLNGSESSEVELLKDKEP